ncbi:hypothetical protein HanIR_Chr03g0118931 [Helianthus annuus]|nr:hypothetical protein HanIR_Chr03g0118931 [Helianthus annuus]
MSFSITMNCTSLSPHSILLTRQSSRTEVEGIRIRSLETCSLVNRPTCNPSKHLFSS